MIHNVLTTTATGITIGGAIDAVTSITGSGDIAIATDKFTLDSATGNAVFGGTSQVAGTLPQQVELLPVRFSHCIC